MPLAAKPVKILIHNMVQKKNLEENRAIHNTQPLLIMIALKSHAREIFIGKKWWEIKERVAQDPKHKRSTRYFLATDLKDKRR